MEIDTKEIYQIVDHCLTLQEFKIRHIKRLTGISTPRIPVIEQMNKEGFLEKTAPGQYRLTKDLNKGIELIKMRNKAEEKLRSPQT